MTSCTIKGVATRSLHRSPTTATLRKCLALGHAWTCSDVCTGGNQAVIPHSPLNGGAVGTCRSVSIHLGQVPGGRYDGDLVIAASTSSTVINGVRSIVTAPVALIMSEMAVALATSGKSQIP